MVEATLAQENLDELHVRLSGCFARVEPLQQARKYVTGLMSDLPRKNCWTLAEHAGDRPRTGCSGCSTTRCGTPPRRWA